MIAMQHRLTIDQFIIVRRMLRRRWRHHEIARALNLSMWTIARIADDRQMRRDPVPEEELPEDDAPADYVANDLRRCGGCGALVYVWPCIACQMATKTGSLRMPEPEEGDDDDWDIDLEIGDVA